MKKKLAKGAVLGALLMGLALLPAAAQPSLTDRSNDLKKLGEWIELDQSFTPAARQTALQAVAALTRQSQQMTDAEFYLEVRKVSALTDNGHSNVGTAPIYEQFGVAPLRTYWFSDGLYIVRARNDLKHLVGGKITALEGLPLDEILDRLKVYHGGTMPFFAYYTASALFLSPAIMQAATLSEDDALTITVALGEGVEEEIVLGPDDVVTGLTRARPWRSMIPPALDGEAPGWTSALDGKSLPLALQDKDALFRYVLLEGGDIAYIQLRANIGNAPISINAFAKNTMERLEADVPRTIILDNRFNGGGDLTRTADLALALPSLVPEDGKVIVLTSPGTFSAGIYTSFYPKAADPDKTVILGEMVGDRPRFWAESRGPFQLPDTGFRISYSLQLHDIGAGCHDKEHCHLINKDAWNVAVGSLEPDVPVETTLADFIAGRDPALEAALALARGSTSQR